MAVTGNRPQRGKSVRPSKNNEELQGREEVEIRGGGDKKQGAPKKRQSLYGQQLAEKVAGKVFYGVREKQFRRFFNVAQRQAGSTGENLLISLERRLDNVLYCLKLSTTRRQARQVIVHRHVLVNGKIVKSPSYLVSIGDVVSIKKATLTQEQFVENVIDKRLNIQQAPVPEWLELRKEDRAGVVLRYPTRSEISVQIEEHRIVELYSK